MVKRPTSEDSTFFATYQEGGRKEGEKKRKKKVTCLVVPQEMS